MNAEAQDNFDAATPANWPSADEAATQSGSSEQSAMAAAGQPDAFGDAQQANAGQAEHGLAVQSERRAKGPASLDAVLGVPVKVQAVLGRTRMPINDLVQLTTGTVVELDRKVGEPVDIFVNDRLIARGEVVMIENALGVTLTEIVREE